MKKTILIAAVLFFAFSVAAVAQTGAQFTVSSVPVTTVTSCGKTETTGDIIFTTSASSLQVVTGTITITYGAPISSTVGTTVSAYDTTSTPALLYPAGFVSILSNSGSSVTIAITPGAVLNESVQIRVSGIKVDVTPPSTTFPIYASVSGTGNSFEVGQTANIPVIISAQSGLGSVSVTSPATINSVFGAGSYTPSVVVTEGYFSGWILGTGIQFSFSQLNSGISFAFNSLTVTGTGGSVFTLVDSTGAVISTAPTYTSASGAFNVFYKMTTLGDINGSIKESITIPVSVTAGTSTLGLGPVTVNAILYSFSTTVPPVYLVGGCSIGTGTVITVVPASTYLLIPFASTVGLYDTAIAIANTTKDPVAAAKQQSGAITFYFYPQDQAVVPFNYSPTGSANGLTSGLLPAGGTYASLLSSLLVDAGKSATGFTGYIFVVVNATNAHGEYFVTDWTGFTHGALMLAVDMATAARQIATGPESLKH